MSRACLSMFMHYMRFVILALKWGYLFVTFHSPLFRKRTAPGPRDLCIDPLFSQITVNDLDVGRSVEETIRLVEAFQFTVRCIPFRCHHSWLPPHAPPHVSLTL